MSAKAVQCHMPSKEKARSCTVEFDDDFELPAVTVQLPVNTPGFPAEFRFEHWWDDSVYHGEGYRIKVVTSFEGSTLPAKEAGDLLTTTLQTAVRMAIAASGEAYERQRLKVSNQRSYEQ
jgi:hypothetical protein